MKESRKSRRATIFDVAAAAGVSVSTVDRVLNRRAPVSAKRAQKVVQAAELVGFYAADRMRQLETQEPTLALGFLLEHDSKPFYATLGRALITEAHRIFGQRVSVKIDYLTDLTPASFVRRMARMAEQTDVIAVVTGDHASVNSEIERLCPLGKPVYALISDLSSPSRAGYVGLDYWREGRTAAWAIARLAKTPGKVGVIVGSHKYRCQQACEASFRAYFRELAPEFTLLDPRITMEDAYYGYENALDLLRRNPDLVGLFINGEGVEGVLQAIGEAKLDHKLIGVGLELTSATRAALQNGTLDIVLSHPVDELAATAVGAMCRRKPSGPPFSRWVLPFEIYTSQNM